MVKWTVQVYFPAAISRELAGFGILGLGFVVFGFPSLSLMIINHNHSRVDLPGWLDILAPPWGGVFLAVVLPAPVLTRLFHKQPLGPAWLGLTFSVQSIIVGSENIKH